MGKAGFQEEAGPVSPVDADLLKRKISELELSIRGTRLEALIQQLYSELEHKQITLRPPCYLSDEWGCPHNVPAIGIPFYLAAPELVNLESEMTGLDVEDEAEILIYLRHEAGHAFNYAYQLYEEEEWRRLFGPYARPYHDDYRPVPFSDRYVRHIAGWYAQKHPDEDFAETFAVWLTPGEHWEETYAATPALEKLHYVDQSVRRHGREPPKVTVQTLHAPVEEMSSTLEQWYSSGAGAGLASTALPRVINADLRALFPSMQGEPARQLLERVQRRLIRDVNYWTGIDPRLLRSLLNDLAQRVDTLALKIPADRHDTSLMDLAILTTTLAMNYLYTGEFVKQ